MALLPLAYQELGELSPEQLRIKALQAASALEEYASSIRQMFNAEKQPMVVQMEPNRKVNGHQPKSALTLLLESNGNEYYDESSESDEWC